MLHLTLFFVTTTGRAVEKGFLFFSYATTYTCFSALFNMLVQVVSSMAAKIMLAFVLMAIMQIVLYRLLLPSFRKVANYILKGWGKFYAVVISFWALIVGRFLFTWMELMNGVDKILCLITMVAFCFSYITIFNSIHSISSFITAYLCFTCDPDVTYVLEYTPSKMSDADIIKMAESVELIEEK